MKSTRKLSIHLIKLYIGLHSYRIQATRIRATKTNTDEDTDGKTFYTYAFKKTKVFWLELGSGICTQTTANVGTPFFVTTQSVSYTHLDVYKRQAVMLGPPRYY